MSFMRFLAFAFMLIQSVIILPAGSHAITLKSSIQAALNSNPEIGEAIASREAVEFELRQARGAYLPSVDLESRYGAQEFSTPTTRRTGTFDDGRDRRETSGTLTQRVFDGFNRRAERHRQASRVDSASFRVHERSESVALRVIQQYLEAGRLYRVLRFAKENLAYHKRVLGDLREGEANGSISAADRQQAEERVFAAEARVVEFEEDLSGAKIRFFRLVGRRLDGYVPVGGASGMQPRSLNDALQIARSSHPSIRSAVSDLDASRASIKRARSEYLPKVDIEVTGRKGHELEGVIGREEELKAELIMRWNLFRGGIDRAKVQEQLRRSDEEREGLRRAHLLVEETVRLAWERRNQQRRRFGHLRDQLASTERLIDSYGEQFKVGERSLLDLLDTQNTRFNTQVSVEAARTTYQLAEYQVLASMGILLQKLSIALPYQSDAYARDEHRVPHAPAEEKVKRRDPGHRWFTRSSP